MNDLTPVQKAMVEKLIAETKAEPMINQAQLLEILNGVAVEPDSIMDRITHEHEDLLRRVAAKALLAGIEIGRNEKSQA